MVCKVVLAPGCAPLQESVDALARREETYNSRLFVEVDKRNPFLGDARM